MRAAQLQRALRIAGPVLDSGAARMDAVPRDSATYASYIDNTPMADVGRPEPARVSRPEAQAPASILEGTRFVSVRVETLHPDHPEWARPVKLYFRRSVQGWQAVGLDRVY